MKVLKTPTKLLHTALPHSSTIRHCEVDQVFYFSPYISRINNNFSKDIRGLQKMESGLTDKRRLYCKHVNDLYKMIEDDIKKYETFFSENLREPRPGVTLCTHGEHFGGIVSKFKSMIEIMNFQVLNHVNGEHMRDQSGRQTNADSGIGSDARQYLTVPIQETTPRQ